MARSKRYLFRGFFCQIKNEQGDTIFRSKNLCKVLWGQKGSLNEQCDDSKKQYFSEGEYI